MTGVQTCALPISSARAAALSGNFIPENVYDNLVSTARAHTGPLQEYVSLRKRVLGIEDFHFYDFRCV